MSSMQHICTRSETLQRWVAIKVKQGKHYMIITMKASSGHDATNVIASESTGDPSYLSHTELLGKFKIHGKILPPVDPPFEWIK